MADFIRHISSGTKIGPYHVANDLPNQDYYGITQEEDFSVFVVADGAGSLQRSDEGSQLVVQSILAISEELLRSNEKLDLTSIVATSIVGARNILKALDFWDEAGCTLTIAIIRKDDFILAGLGDSFGVIQESSGALHLMQPPEAGEYANITKLITSKDFIVSSIAGNTYNLRALALCSDAFELSTLQNRIPTKGFWGNVFSMADSKELEVDSLIDFMDQRGKIEDDATMIVAAIDNDDEMPEDEIIYSQFTVEEIEDLVITK